MSCTHVTTSILTPRHPQSSGKVAIYCWAPALCSAVLCLHLPQIEESRTPYRHMSYQLKQVWPSLDDTLRRADTVVTAWLNANPDLLDFINYFIEISSKYILTYCVHNENQTRREKVPLWSRNQIRVVYWRPLLWPALWVLCSHIISNHLASHPESHNAPGGPIGKGYDGESPD